MRPWILVSVHVGVCELGDGEGVSVCNRVGFFCVDWCVLSDQIYYSHF